LLDTAGVTICAIVGFLIADEVMDGVSVHVR
jgi:hypothetical protein